MQHIDDEPLPPPTPPVVVEGGPFHEPFQDRELLTSCLNLLAINTYKALKVDCMKKARYARRLVLGNRVPGSPESEETYLVKLPYDQTCWNDLDAESIEFLMLATIKNVELDHTWYKPRTYFDQFLSQVAKDFMDAMDTRYLCDGEPVTPQTMCADNTDTTRIESNIATPPVTDQVPIEVTVDDDDDDDDDVTIVDVVYAKGPSNCKMEMDTR